MNRSQSSVWDELTLGMCYYPEQWDKKIWVNDLTRMKKLGVSVIRIAEFSWCIFEPEEGKFHFDFFDEFLDRAEEEQMKVIFCTPTAAPPAWLTEKYPEVLNARIDGVKYRHGMRRHYNYNSQVYRELSKRIVEKLAEHYGKRKSIIGWQIDNEINCAMDEFYSESDTLAFRKFLQTKYGTLDALNQAWGNVFWNQTYTKWEEIHLPRVTVYQSTNPHMCLDYIRFISDSAIRFCRMQSEIIRKYKKESDFVTTNGLFRHLDNHKMMRNCLDTYCYDSYPNFAYCLGKKADKNDLKDRKWSRNLTEVRSVCGHFGITEQQAGASGWISSTEATAPKPGQMMLWAMQSIMHGADYIGFFRWRTSVMGTEIYWNGILDWNNQDNRKTEELEKIHQRVRKISEISGAKYAAGMGLVKDYDNLWDAEIDVWHRRMTDSSEKAIFIVSQLTHTPMDMIYFTEETDAEALRSYSVLFYPHPLILTEERTQVLMDYVKAGGTLIIGARSGVKDVTGKCVMKPGPGLFAEFSQTNVQDGTLVDPDGDPVQMNWSGKKIGTGVFNEIIAVNGGDANILAEYCADYYCGKPALVETPVGKGKILHFGGTFTIENVTAFLEYTGTKSPYENIIRVPEECEIAMRTKDGKGYLFVLNYRASTVRIELRKEAFDMDEMVWVKGECDLQPYETKVYLIKEETT